MASFRFGPLKSPNRRLLSHQNHQAPFSIDPSQMPGSLEQTQNGPTTPKTHRSPASVASPSRGRCVKEYEEQLQQLQHENFNLKLRVFLLEERVGKALGRTDAADIIKTNIELKVENETLKKSLDEKCKLLAQASTAIEQLEHQQKEMMKAHQTEKEALDKQIQQLQTELTEALEEMRTSTRAPGFHLPDDSADLYAQAFGSIVLPHHQPTCNIPDHYSKHDVDELQGRISELLAQVADQAQKLSEMTEEVNQSQAQVMEYRQKMDELEADVVQLEQARDDNCLRIANLGNQLEAKQQQICALQQQCGNSQQAANLEPSDKDKIIEEKQSQLEQQNKILVEIQITLDEKQKQIQELEGNLSEKKKKVEELEKSLTKAGRSLQGFVLEVQKKEKETEHLKSDLRKRDKRIKDLVAELKEAQELLNKAKWEAEVSGKEDNVKAMAEEENERLWAELEEKKRLLVEVEQQKSSLLQDSQQLATLRQTVGQKEQAVTEAESQIATLKRRVAELQQQMASRASPSTKSEVKHSEGSIEQAVLANQLASYVREKKELTETVQVLRDQLVALQNGQADPSAAVQWKHQYDESQKKSEALEKELQRLKAEVRAWRKKAETGLNANEYVKHYKKEVTVLRQKLADSSNACDLLRTRLEEMADFLEEILSMSQQELMNLSNWSSSRQRRQILQQSIMHSRELSRSLSQSIMIALGDMDELQQSTSSASSVVTERPAHPSRVHSPDQLPPPDAITDDGQMDRSTSSTTGQQQVIEQLRCTVTQLEEQIKERDEAISLLKKEKADQLNSVTSQAAINRSMQTEAPAESVRKMPPVSSTPYRPARASDFLSPLPASAKPGQSLLTNCMLEEGSDFIQTKESGTPVGRPEACKIKSDTKSTLPVVVSESDGWSEPDRTVSFARIGLPIEHHIEANSIAAVLSNKKQRSHSNGGDTDSSDSSSPQNGRRARSDPGEQKRVSNRLRTLEQENTRLRIQLAELVNTLRSTYDGSIMKDDVSLFEDSQQQSREEESLLAEERRRSIEDVEGAGDTTVAQFIINSLNNRLIKLKDTIKRKEQKLRETKDLVTQLELKSKEKYFQNCETQLLLKETQERLTEKSQLVETLEARWIEAQAQWASASATKDREAAEMRGTLDTRESELRAALMKAQLWENSFQDCQKSLRQLDCDRKAELESVIQSKVVIEQELRLVQSDCESIKIERDRLQMDLDSLKEKLKLAQAQERTVTTPLAPQRSGLQRQGSQMSDYVSDQATSDVPFMKHQMKINDENGTRPSSLHLSPDLGIDSDQGRFSTIERLRKGSRISGYSTGDEGTPKRSDQAVAQGMSPDVLQPLSTNCPNCPRWQNKYLKAKQTLAATLEKLQAANLRKEKVDRALNKELGKTHNILCQARGLLEQANQGSH